MPRRIPVCRFALLSSMVFIAAVERGGTLLAGQDTVFTPSEGPTPAVGTATQPAASPSATPAAGSGAAGQADARAEEFEVTIIQALDQKIDFDVSNAPLRQAVQDLSDKTGIPIEIDRGTLELLPYGSKTILSATIQGRSLREGLIGLLRPIGLEFAVRGGKLMIGPTRLLRRIVRRATWEELRAIESLSTRPFSKELFDSLKFQFQDAGTGEGESNRQTLLRLAATVGAGSAGEVLEHACSQYGWAWYPEGDRIAVLTKAKQVDRQLETRVSLQYAQISLRDALLDLASRAGVLLQLEPGVLTKLPPQTGESLSLFIENATVRQALEVVTGLTGLGYFIEPDGIRFAANSLAASANPAGSVEAAVRALRTNSIVGQITIPGRDGTSFAFFIREDDLPPEVNEMRRNKVHNAVNDIRRLLAEEEPKD